MTLDEIVEKTYNGFLKEYYLDVGNKSTKDVIREACLSYAKSIVPEEKLKPTFEDFSFSYSLPSAPWNACRTQILSRIEEDEQLTWKKCKKCGFLPKVDDWDCTNCGEHLPQDYTSII